jgi:hypothetical protein
VKQYAASELAKQNNEHASIEPTRGSARDGRDAGRRAVRVERISFRRLCA